MGREQADLPTTMFYMMKTNSLQMPFSHSQTTCAIRITNLPLFLNLELFQERFTLYLFDTNSTISFPDMQDVLDRFPLVSSMINWLFSYFY